METAAFRVVPENCGRSQNLSDFAELSTPLRRSALAMIEGARVLSGLSPEVLPLPEVLEQLRDLKAHGVRNVLWKIESCGGDTVSAFQLHDAIQRFTADGSRLVFYVPEPRYPEPEGNCETSWRCSISHDGGYLASCATMWPLAGTVVMHPRAFLLLHGPVLIGAEFMPPWRERLVNFYERASAGLMPRDLLVRLMAIDKSELACPVRATDAVRWGLADHVGDEDFAYEIARGQRYEASPRRARRAELMASANLPPGQPQGIVNNTMRAGMYRVVGTGGLLADFYGDAGAASESTQGIGHFRIADSRINPATTTVQATALQGALPNLTAVSDVQIYAGYADIFVKDVTTGQYITAPWQATIYV
jgi:hypothetical protein